MSVRTVELVTGREFSISIEKTGSPIIIGCASNINYSGQKEVLTANCQTGRKKLPSGDDPDYTITVDGFVHIYLTANVAANISAKEIETFMQGGTQINWSYKAPHVGDPIRSGTGYITAFSQSSPVEGLATYNFTITPFAMPTITVGA